MILSKISRFFMRFKYIHSFLLFIYKKTLGVIVDKNRSKKVAQNFEGLIVFIGEVSTFSGCKIWPAFGTLLGLHRDNGPIAHDLDIDFSAYHRDRDVVIAKLEDSGAKVVKSYFEENIENIVLQDVIEVPGLGCFDLFYFHENEKITYYYDFVTNITTTFQKNSIKN